MDLFKIETDYDLQGNSPWDAVWYDGDYRDLKALKCELGLAPIWKPPAVRIEQRLTTPNIYVFELFYAVDKGTMNLLKSLVRDSAEFLPLEAGKPLFALHPLLRVELDYRAVFGDQVLTGNVTHIPNYVFPKGELTSDVHLCQIRQPPGTNARDVGFPCTGVFVSERFRSLCVKNDLKGIRFSKVWSSGRRRTDC